MTTPCRQDPAGAVLMAAAAALMEWFKPGAICPAEVGTTEHVRVFAGEGHPVHTCGDEPFIWLRLVRRYRSQTFPTQSIDTNPCGLLRVVAVEVGVEWCAVIDEEPRMSDLAREAEISLDVSWRLEQAMCLASQLLTADGAERHVGTDILAPYGPYGDAIGWTGLLYASY